MPGFLYDYFELLFGCMLAAAIGLIAYWWCIVRWYVYAGLVLTSAVANQWLGLTFTASFIIPGVIILGCGIVILRGFLRDYPVIKEENIHDDR